MKRRVTNLAHLAALAAAAWLTMMTLHECGHIWNAWLSGGRVERVILHPLAFSRTDLSSNPHPLFVAWGGVIWGSVIPLALWTVARLLKRRLAFVLRFFAGFCLIANGVYLASGLALPVGDAQDLIRLGTRPWMLAALGLPIAAAGLALWNGLSRHFGLNAQTDRPAFAAALIWLGVVVVGMLALNAIAQ